MSEGKCLLTRSATLSFRSTLGPASPSPSLEDWAAGAEDRFSKRSLKKSARPPEPASTSQGMEVFRERSTLWQREGKEKIVCLRSKIREYTLLKLIMSLWLYLQHARLPWHQHTKDRDVNAAAAYKNTSIFTFSALADYLLVLAERARCYNFAQVPAWCYMLRNRCVSHSCRGTQWFSCSGYQRISLSSLIMR